jgi:hypothetical protein
LARALRVQARSVTVPCNMAATAKFPDGTTKRLESGHHTFVIPQQREP